MQPSLTRISLLALVCLAVAPDTRAQIQWTESVELALERAKAESKVIFVAINMDGERANDQMVEDHYRDATLVKLSRNTINLFCSNDEHGKGRCSRCKGVTCAQHRANDFQVRRQFLKVDGDTPVIAPQHLFVSAEGKILLSVPYFVTKGELEWMWVRAIRELQPDFAWTLTDRGRAPEGFRKGEADTTKRGANPPTKEEVRKALDDIKKLGSGGRSGGGGWADIMRDAQKNSRIIIRSDEKRALDWGQGSLRGYSQFRNALIRDIGKVSPKPWAKVIQEWLEDREAATRKTTAIALEELASADALNALRKAAKAEKDEDIHGRILRAMAASAPTNRSVIASITKVIKTHKSETLRAQAVLAAGKLEKRDAITTCLRAALQDTSTLVRSVAAYVIAIRQDKELAQHLESASRAESEDSVRDWMEKALESIKTGETKAFASFLEGVLGETDPGAQIDQWRDRMRQREKEAADKDGKDKGKRP